MIFISKKDLILFIIFPLGLIYMFKSQQKNITKEIWGSLMCIGHVLTHVGHDQQKSGLGIEILLCHALFGRFDFGG